MSDQVVVHKVGEKKKQLSQLLSFKKREDRRNPYSLFKREERRRRKIERRRRRRGREVAFREIEREPIVVQFV